MKVRTKNIAGKSFPESGTKLKIISKILKAQQMWGIYFFQRSYHQKSSHIGIVVIGVIA